jgi:hypothetical protein
MNQRSANLETDITINQMLISSGSEKEQRSQLKLMFTTFRESKMRLALRFLLFRLYLPKIGATIEEEEFLQLNRILNPDKKEGKLFGILRLGVGNIR